MASRRPARDGTRPDNAHRGATKGGKNELGTACCDARRAAANARAPACHHDQHWRHHRCRAVRRQQCGHLGSGPRVSVELPRLGADYRAADADAGRNGRRAAAGAFFHGVHARGAGQRRGLRVRLAVLVLLGGGYSDRSHRRGGVASCLATVAYLGAGTGARCGHDRRQPDVGPLLRRVRVLVRLHQGGGHHHVHLTRGRLRGRLLAARTLARRSCRPRRLRAPRGGCGARRIRDSLSLR